MHTDKNTAEEEIHSEWARLGFRLAISAAMHPLDYAKTLIHLGYEPLGGQVGRNMLGKPAMVLPNVFEYANYIRKLDGWNGWYRGLTPKLVGILVSMTLRERIVEYLGLEEWDPEIEPENEKELYEQFKVTLKRDIVLTATGVIFSYPFRVISVRMMAQFFGSETLYRSILGSIREIYHTNGLLGFYSGFIPRILCDLSCLVLTGTTVYVFRKWLIKRQTLRPYNGGIAQIFKSLVELIYSSRLYPLEVVSTCMSVSGSNLTLGMPPIMPAYTGWVQCYHDLKAQDEFKARSLMFWRSICLPVKRNPNDGYIPMPPLEPYRQKQKAF